MSETKHGGSRPGAGRKPGSGTVAEPRNVRKLIRWTEKEWATIEERAALVNMSTTDYQRLPLNKYNRCVSIQEPYVRNDKTTVGGALLQQREYG